MDKTNQADARGLSRRDMLRCAAAGTALIGASGFRSHAHAQGDATNGRLNQSIASWCFEQYKDYIGHYHTAGNPGRHELDEAQEINYRAVFEAIAETGFAGYIGHEFIATRDPLDGLREAVALCGVSGVSDALGTTVGK